MAAPGIKGYTVRVNMLKRLLPIALFALGCFPSRGLYFLLHAAAPSGIYHSHQPVLNAPSSRTPKFKPAKVRLPARLSRMPRSLKQTPDVPAPALLAAFNAPPAGPPARRAIFTPVLRSPRTLPASPPPARAPPAA